VDEAVDKAVDKAVDRLWKTNEYPRVKAAILIAEIFGATCAKTGYVPVYSPVDNPCFKSRKL
jgi:hypothetical protein